MSTDRDKWRQRNRSRRNVWNVDQWYRHPALCGRDLRFSSDGELGRCQEDGRTGKHKIVLFFGRKIVFWSGYIHYYQIIILLHKYEIFTAVNVHIFAEIDFVNANAISSIWELRSTFLLFKHDGTTPQNYGSPRKVSTATTVYQIRFIINSSAQKHISTSNL